MTGPSHDHANTNLFREFVDTPPAERMAMLQARSRDQLADLARAELHLQEAEPQDENARALWRSARARSAVGTPDMLRQYMKKYEDGHLDIMLLIAQAGSRKHEDIMASIELFGKTVLPEFKERHETEHKPWREQQLQSFKYPVNSSI